MITYYRTGLSRQVPGKSPKDPPKLVALWAHSPDGPSRTAGEATAAHPESETVLFSRETAPWRVQTARADRGSAKALARATRAREREIEASLRAAQVAAAKEHTRQERELATTAGRVVGAMLGVIWALLPFALAEC